MHPSANINLTGPYEETYFHSPNFLPSWKISYALFCGVWSSKSLELKTIYLLNTRGFSLSYLHISISRLYKYWIDGWFEYKQSKCCMNMLYGRCFSPSNKYEFQFNEHTCHPHSLTTLLNFN